MIVIIGLLTIDIQLIKSTDDFLSLSKNNTAQNYFLQNDLDFSQVKNYRPFNFTGVLDGCGFAIKNLNITNYIVNFETVTNVQQLSTAMTFRNDVYNESSTEIGANYTNVLFNLTASGVVVGLTAEDGTEITKDNYQQYLNKTISFKRDNQTVGIFSNLGQGTVIKNIQFINVSLIYIQPGAAFETTLYSGIIAAKAQDLILSNVNLSECYVHLANNINLRYVGGFVGKAKNLTAISVRSTNVVIVQKHVGNGYVTGFVIGGIVGRCESNLTVISSSINVQHQSEAEYMIHNIGSIAGYLGNYNCNYSNEEIAQIINTNAETQLDLPYQNKTYLSFISNANRMPIDIQLSSNTVSGTFPTNPLNMIVGLVAARGAANITSSNSYFSVNSNTSNTTELIIYQNGDINSNENQSVSLNNQFTNFSLIGNLSHVQENYNESQLSDENFYENDKNSTNILVNVDQIVNNTNNLKIANKNIPYTINVSTQETTTVCFNNSMCNSQQICDNSICVCQGIQLATEENTCVDAPKQCQTLQNICDGITFYCDQSTNQCLNAKKQQTSNMMGVIVAVAASVIVIAIIIVITIYMVKKTQKKKLLQLKKKKRSLRGQSGIYYGRTVRLM